MKISDKIAYELLILSLVADVMTLTDVQFSSLLAKNI